VWVAIYHADSAKEKRYLRGKAPMFRRGKNSMLPEIEMQIPSQGNLTQTLARLQE
jgi:hypothetical protein